MSVETNLISCKETVVRGLSTGALETHGLYIQETTLPGVLNMEVGLQEMDAKSFLLSLSIWIQSMNTIILLNYANTLLIKNFVELMERTLLSKILLELNALKSSLNLLKLKEPMIPRVTIGLMEPDLMVSLTTVLNVVTLVVLSV